MFFSVKHIKASSTNPFDKSYHHLQQTFDAKIIKHLSSVLNLTVTLIKTPLISDIPSYHQNADNWILEQIVNGSADISSTTLVLTSESSRACQYSFGLEKFRPQLYYKVRSLRDNGNIYLTPFSSNVWICIILLCFLLTLVLTFILSREANLPHKISYDVLARLIDIKEDRDVEWGEDLPYTSIESLHQREKWEMSEILLACLGALCQQGSSRDPSTHAARILLLVFFLLAAVSYTAYSASVISYISFFPYNSERHLNITNFSVKNQVVLYNTDKIQRELKFFFGNIEEASLKKGFNKVIKGEALFVGDRDVSLSYIHQQKYNSDTKCKIGRTFLDLEYHRVIAMKKNFELREKINQKILQMQQFGLLQREKRTIFNLRPPCTFSEKSSLSNFVSFDISDVKPALSLLGFGLMVSIILLLLEHLLHFYWT